MKINIGKNIKWILLVGLVGYLAYASYDWYWTIVSWVHPDIDRKYAEQFSTLPDDQLEKIMKERPSSRTNGAMWAWEARHPVDKPFVAWTNTTQGK